LAKPKDFFVTDTSTEMT